MYADIWGFSAWIVTVVCLISVSICLELFLEIKNAHNANHPYLTYIMYAKIITESTVTVDIVPPMMASRAAKSIMFFKVYGIIYNIIIQCYMVTWVMYVQIECYWVWE